MPYILSVIPADSSDASEISAGAIRAVVDDPSIGTLAVGNETYVGRRYLIVTDEGGGYLASNRFAKMPSGNGDAVLHIPTELRGEFTSILSTLQHRSSHGKLILYLEANRIISRPPTPGDPAPKVEPRLLRFANLDSFIKAVESDLVAEEVIATIG